MWWIDFPTLVLIIAAAIYVGLLGAFGIDILASYDAAPQIKAAMGLSGLWQLSRQRFT